MISLETAENALKDVYLGVISNQLNTCDPFLAKVKKTRNDVWGKEIRVLRYLGFSNEEIANVVQLKEELRNLYATMEISDKAVRCSQNSAGAFVNLINDSCETMIRTSVFDISRQLSSDGTSKLFNITSITPEGKLKVDTTTHIMGYENIILHSDTENRMVFITEVDRTRREVELSEPLVNKTFTYATKTNEKEIVGLKAIFDNEVLYGVRKSDYSFMQPKQYIEKMYSSVLNAIYNGLSQVESDPNCEPINYIMCNSKTKMKLQEELAEKHQHIEIIELDGGYKAIGVNGIPVSVNRFMKDDEIYLLNTNDFNFHELCDWKWLEDSNGHILRQDTRLPKYKATLVKYGNLICTNPSNQCRVVVD